VTVHAFVDESRRGSYLLVAAVVEPAQLAPGRVLLRGMCRPQDRRLHFNAMTDPRRRKTAAALAAAPLRCWVYLGRGEPESARQVCLAQLLTELLAVQCQRLVIESRGSSDDARDARTLNAALGPTPSKSGLVHEHLRPYEDPLLWVPDAVAWCYGAGGDWRRRIAPLVQRSTDLGAV
jgi:hypothetical protein